MKKIRLFSLALFTSAFCFFSGVNTDLAMAVSPNYNPQADTASEAGQEAPDTPESLSESGAGIYKDAGALWQSWMASRQPDESPYPDYICGVWSTDGTIESLTFAVTKDEAGEAGKQEILDLVADDSTVSFTYQSYPYYELWAIQLVLRDELGDETGIRGFGIYEDENRIHISFDASKENGEAIMEEYFQKYQDRICFEIGEATDTAFEEYAFHLEEYDSYLDKGMAGRLAGKKTGHGISAWAWAALAGIFFLSGAIFLRARSLAVLQTNKGSTTAPSPATRKQVIETIRKNTAEPGQGTFQAILGKLDGK